MSPTDDRDLKPTSELLEEIRDHEGGERIELGEVIEATQGRAHGLILVTLSLPETIPMIGLSAILATPIFVLGILMVAKGSHPPIPGWIRSRSLPRKKVDGAIGKTLPAIRWLERFSRPRLPRFAGAGRLQGAVCVLMAIVLAVPIPGLNLLAAAAVAGTGLGVLQRDGATVLVAAVLALLAAIGFIAVLSGAWTLVT